RTSAGDSTDDSLRAARLARAALREEEVGVAARAEVDAVDVLDARAPQRALRRRPQVEDPPAREPRVEERRHLRTDLVAARADRRPDDRRLRAVAERGNGGIDHPVREPTPARVHNGERGRG